MINFLEDIKMRHNRSDVRLPNSRYFQISRVARDQTFEIFSSPDFSRVKKLLPSLRRLSRLFDMEPVEVGLRRPNDVLFDLKGSQEAEISVGNLKSLLQQVQMLCSAYYPLAEYKATRSDADFYFDADELADIAKFVVDKVVWRTLEVSDDAPNEMVDKLSRKVGGNLMSLRFYARRIYRTGKYYDGNFFQESSDMPRFDDINSDALQDTSLAMAYYDRPEDELGDQFAFDYLKRWGGKTFPTDEAINNIQTFARKIGLPKIMYLVSKMDDRAQLAFLTYLGYFGENQRDILYVAKSLGIEASTMRADLWRVSLQLDKLYTPDTVKLLDSSTPIPIYPHVLANRLIEHKAIRMNRRVLHHDSSRLVLRNFSNNPDYAEFLKSLTPTELQVLNLALEMSGERFSLNDGQISEQTGLVPKQISKIITKLRRRAEKSVVKFITQDGRMLRETESQHNLILRKRKIENWQLSCLSPLQNEVFLELTQPDDKGKYPSQEEVLKRHGVTDGKFVPHLLKKLSNETILKELTDLRKKISFILSHPGRFTERDQKIATFIEQQIQSGIPLWGVTGGIGYTAIAKELGLEPFQVRSLFKDKVKIENVPKSI